MTSSSGVGIYSVAYCMGDHVRKNDYWPQEVVAEWIEQDKLRSSAPRDITGFTKGMIAVYEAMIEDTKDPFRGVYARYMANPEETSTDLATTAARRAIEKAGIDSQEIDLVLENSLLVEDLNANNGCLIHRKLGLPERCFTMTTQAACNAFPMHLILADQMIRSGQSRLALTVHSFLSAPVNDPRDQLSSTFGNGAAAAIVGPVREGYGVLSHAFQTHSQFYNALKLTVKDGFPWEEGPCTFILDGKEGFGMLLAIYDSAEVMLRRALAGAGYKASDIDFYACHQATTWMNRLTAEASGLTNARTYETFPYAGNMSSVNLPFVLARGQEENLLKDDDLIAMFTGGAGVTNSGMVLRWGR